MPIYEYACPDCGHEFEQLRKVSDPRLTDCPSCAGDQLRKKVSATSFTLKGSGWYKDHYGLKSSSGSDGDGGGKDAGGSKDAGGGGDSSGGDSGGTSPSTSTTTTTSSAGSE